MLLIGPDNYKQVLPVIKQCIPDDQDIIRNYIEQFEQIIIADDLSDHELAVKEINEFYETINQLIAEGDIEIPEDKKKLFISPPLPSPTTRATYPFNKIKPVIVLPNQRHTTELIEKNIIQNMQKPGFIGIKTNEPDLEQTNKINPKNLQTTRSTYTLSNSPLLNTENTEINQKNTQTTRATYTPSENESEMMPLSEVEMSEVEMSEVEKQELKELRLPESKEYIYKEIRRKFGRPVNKENLQRFGTNRFARDVQQSYPEKYGITEIKYVLRTVLMLEKSLE